jgi:ADP-ribose pyrophosphatase
MKKKVKIKKREICHDGFFRLERYWLRHELFAGGMSDTLERELFVRRPAAAALLYDPVLNRVVMVEQFRIGALEHPGGAWLLECVAGMVEAGESAEDVIRREALEEAGCEVIDLLHLYEFYPAPGGSCERIALYLARVDASSAGGIFGLSHEGEDIRVHAMSLDSALRKIETGEIDSSYTIMALQWLVARREEITKTWSV